MEEQINSNNMEQLININSTETEYFSQDPNKLELNKCIEANKNKDSLGEYILYKSFFDGNQYLISANKDTFNLDLYDLNNGNLIKSLKGHTNRVDHIRYFCNNNKSYFVSSDTNHTVIIWDENFKILNKIETGNKGSITSSYLLFHKNEKDYVIIIPSTELNEFTKIYDNKGKFIKNVYNTNNNISFHLDVWNYNNNHYLIETCFGKISIINLFKDEIYHEFVYNPQSCHFDGIIYNKNYYIIYSNFDINNSNSFIVIYDLIDKNIYKLIEVNNYDIESFCLWNSKYLLLCRINPIHKNVQLYNLETLKEETRIIDQYYVKISEAKKINLNNYGESIVISDNENKYKIFSIKK